MPAEDGGGQWKDAWMPPFPAEPLPEEGSSAASQIHRDIGRPHPLGNSGQFYFIEHGHFLCPVESTYLWRSREQETKECRKRKGSRRPYELPVIVVALL